MRPAKPCAKCIRYFGADCSHLGVMYDKALLKGLTEQDLIEYALNRLWALDRDNTSKAAGNKASRVYKSRNLTTQNALANKCTATRGPLRCMRNAGHDDNHKF